MKLPYFKLKDAFEEARDSFSYGSGSEKVSSTAKLFGKVVANVGMFAAEASVEMLKQAPENMARAHAKKTEKILKEGSHQLSDEEKEKLIQSMEKSQAFIKNAEEKRRLEREKKEEEREAAEKEGWRISQKK